MPRDYDLDGTPEGVFGAELRFYRTRAGLSQAELAALVNISHDVISKIETGERAPAKAFPERLDAVPELDTRAGLARLWNHLGKSARHRVYPGWFDRWPDAEARATALRTFEPLVVPGLLQTDQYARALLRTRIGDTDEEIDEMVAARLERQAVFSKDKPPTLWVVLDEGVLHRVVGGAEVMREQVKHLAEAARRPNVVIQVIPASTGAHQGLNGGAFVLADLPGTGSVAYQDTAVSGQIVESAEGIAALAVLWDTLRAEALSRAASLELIEEVAKTWT